MANSIKITVTESSKSIRVEFNGEISTGKWNNNGGFRAVKGNELHLEAAQIAWVGQVGEFEISEEEFTTILNGG